MPSPSQRIRAWVSRGGTTLVVATLLGLAFVAYFWADVFVTIPSGYVGVRWSPLFGTDRTRTLSDGLNVIWPWDKVTQYDMRLQERTDTIKALTKSGLDVTVITSTRFRLRENLVGELQATVGPEYERKIIKPEVTGAVRRVVGNYDMEEIYAQQGGTQAHKELRNQVAGEFDDRVIDFDHFVVLRIAIPDSIQHAIQNKLTAQQVELSQEYVIQTAEFEAKKKAVEAQGVADFSRISGVPALRWKELQVAEEFAKSPNAKTIVLGGSGKGLPFVISPDKPDK